MLKDSPLLLNILRGKLLRAWALSLALSPAVTDHLNCLPPHLSAAEPAPGAGCSYSYSYGGAAVQWQCSAVLLQIDMTHCSALQDILLMIMLSTDCTGDYGHGQP